MINDDDDDDDDGWGEEAWPHNASHENQPLQATCPVWNRG